MFFTSISQMMTESVDLTLVIRKANGQLTVSTLPKANGLKDEAQNHIVPLTLTGTPEEMDAEFLQHIMQPIRKATGLISNLMEFEKQADKAAANSKAAKDAKAKETKEEKEKREKYEKHMKKAEELITAKNHKDAITALQQARMYATADKQKEVDEDCRTEEGDEPRLALRDDGRDSSTCSTSGTTAKCGIATCTADYPAAGCTTTDAATATTDGNASRATADTATCSATSTASVWRAANVLRTTRRLSTSKCRTAASSLSAG